MTFDTTMRILIVDDFRTMTQILDNLLRQLGFRHIDQTTDGARALKMVQAGQYDLIISDWSMNPVSGLDILKAARASAKNKTTPFLLTAGPNMEHLLAARREGVSDYILKPFNAAMLEKKIAAILARPAVSRNDQRVEA